MKRHYKIPTSNFKKGIEKKDKLKFVDLKLFTTPKQPTLDSSGFPLAIVEIRTQSSSISKKCYNVPFILKKEKMDFSYLEK